MTVTKIHSNVNAARLAKRPPNRDLFGDAVLKDADPSSLTPRAKINDVELAGFCRESDSISPQFKPIGEFFGLNGSNHPSKKQSPRKGSPPQVSAPTPAPKPLTDAQKAAISAATAAIEAAISEPDPVVALPQVPQPILPMPPLPRMNKVPATSEPLVVVSGIESIQVVSAPAEPAVVLLTDAQVDVLLASARYNAPRKIISEFVQNVRDLVRDVVDEIREAFKPTTDELGYVQKPNYVGFGLTAAFSSVAAIGALLIALNPFGVKETTPSSMVASLSTAAPISVSFENPQRNLVEPVISAPAPLEISRDVAVVTPTSVDMDFTTGEVSAPRRHHSRHHVLRSASTTTTSSSALVKVESLGSSHSVSVALSSKQFGRSRLFVGEVVGDSSVSTGTTVAGPRLIIDRTLSRMGLSMNDLPPQVASLISANTPKSLTNFATLVEAEAFRQVSPSLEEKQDIWMIRASLNADQLRQYARVLGATGLFN